MAKRFIFFKTRGGDVQIVRPKKKGGTISDKKVTDVRNRLTKKVGKGNLVFFKTA